MHVHNRTASASGDLLRAATEALILDPSASLADVARAAGISRTTLHKLYPTRHALLVALAEEALTLLESTYAEALQPGTADADPVDQLRRLVVDLVPLGPRIQYLLRERSLDVEPDLAARVEALDLPVNALIRQLQQAGRVRRDVSDEWVVASLNALIYVAWELVAMGRLAPVDAPDLVLRTLLDGVAEEA
jgi:AcrR family transcriptional regulator